MIGEHEVAEVIHDKMFFEQGDGARRRFNRDLLQFLQRHDAGIQDQAVQRDAHAFNLLGAGRDVVEVGEFAFQWSRFSVTRAVDGCTPPPPPWPACARCR